jgi:hypothetical protein
MEEEDREVVRSASPAFLNLLLLLLPSCLPPITLFYLFKNISQINLRLKVLFMIVDLLCLPHPSHPPTLLLLSFASLTFQSGKKKTPTPPATKKSGITLDRQVTLLAFSATLTFVFHFPPPLSFSSLILPPPFINLKYKHLNLKFFLGFITTDDRQLTHRTSPLFPLLSLSQTLPLLLTFSLTSLSGCYPHLLTSRPYSHSVPSTFLSVFTLLLVMIWLLLMIDLIAPAPNNKPNILTSFATFFPWGKRENCQR